MVRKAGWTRSSRNGRAIAVRLVNLGWFRVGSDEYVRSRVTTLRRKHVKIRASLILRVVGARDTMLDAEEYAQLRLL
jgi:hypothetical protein